MAIERVDGVVRRYGPVDVDRKDPRIINTHGNVRQLTFTFSFDDLPTANSAAAELLGVPANSIILRSEFEVLTAFVGGTDYIIGTEQSDGTDIDTNGIYTASALPVADIDTVGKRVIGDGALIGADSGVFNGFFIVIANGTFTAGVARVVVDIAPLRGV